jgi:hypothetical protein
MTGIASLAEAEHGLRSVVHNLALRKFAVGHTLFDGQLGSSFSVVGVYYIRSRRLLLLHYFL